MKFTKVVPTKPKKTLKFKELRPVYSLGNPIENSLPVKPKVEENKHSLSNEKSISYESLIDMLKSVMASTSRSYIVQTLNTLADNLRIFSKTLEAVGDGYGARRAKELASEVPSLIDAMELGKRKFFTLFNEYRKRFIDIDTNREVISEEPTLVEDDLTQFKHIPETRLDLKGSTGAIVNIPVSFLLGRPIPQAHKTILQSQGLVFSKNTSLVLYRNAQFFVLNVKKHKGESSTVITYALQRIVGDDSLLTIRDVRRRFDTYYVELIVPDKVVRSFNVLVSCAKVITVHAHE